MKEIEGCRLPDRSGYDCISAGKKKKKKNRRFFAVGVSGRTKPDGLVEGQGGGVAVFRKPEVYRQGERKTEKGPGTS